jgi:DNA-binding PadR family transcriptional regulator
MSAKHALLGLLLDGPAYPYQLNNRLQERLGPTWEINSGQLYQTIAKLEREGLIERVERGATRRAARQVFEITEPGQEEVERWRLEEDAPEARLSRRPLLLKLSLAGPERLEDALGQIDVYEVACTARLNEMKALRDEAYDEGPLVRADNVLLRIGLSGDIFQLEGELGWARFARERISWLLSHDAIWPGAHDRPGTPNDHETERRGAREDLFGRMAARNLRSEGD